MLYGSLYDNSNACCSAFAAGEEPVYPSRLVAVGASALRDIRTLRAWRRPATRTFASTMRMYVWIRVTHATIQVKRSFSAVSRVTYLPRTVALLGSTRVRSR